MPNIHFIKSDSAQESISAQARADNNTDPHFVMWRDQNVRAADAFADLDQKDRVFLLGVMEEMAAEVKAENSRIACEWEQRALLKKESEHA